MPVKLKLAQSARELNDVFWLRHQVYNREEGYFRDAGAEGTEEGFLIDPFDAHPYCANIIAYDHGEPVGTLRINVDTGGGLPADEHFDFSRHRAEIATEWEERGRGEVVVVGSAGMLAIRSAWRSRRDVIRALFKMAAIIGHEFGVTHAIATINVKSHVMYRRIGFRALAEKIWVDEIGEHIVPMAIPFTDYYRWAVGDLIKDQSLLRDFMQTPERLLLHKGEVLFKEGDQSSEAYVVDSGNVAITCSQQLASGELAITALTRGDTVGELALVDLGPRSATATALTSVELVTLDRKIFMDRLRASPELLQKVLELFASRLRRMDELTTVLVFGDSRQRLDYALADIRGNALPNAKHPERLVAKMGAAELAKGAGVEFNEAEDYLKDISASGLLEVKGDQIIFFSDAETA